MGTLWQDLRYGWRMMLTSPGLTAVAVASLALGIGANTAIFSFVNAVLLRPLPVAEPERLVYLFGGTERHPYGVTAYPDYVDYRDQSGVFEGLATYSGISLSFTGGERTELVSGSIVSGNYFDVLGVKAALGRTFLPEEDQTPGARPVAVLSHGWWQRRFGGDPQIVGRQLTLNGQSFTVVGVAAAGFQGAGAGETNDLFVPMMMQALVRPPRGGYSGEMNPDLLSRRSAGWLVVVGRLGPGVTLEQAQSAVATVAGRLRQAYPESNEGRVATLYPASKGDPNARGMLLSVSGLLLATVGLVLLIACANVANLLLARASARRREISIRLALGAGRWRLVRQLLTESALLAFIGGAVGLLLALWTVDLLKQAVPAGLMPFAFDFSLDGRVLGFTLGLSLLTGMIFGLAPALQASRPDLLPALKDESQSFGTGARRFGLRNLLVVVQIALSLVLLIGAGLFLRSLRQAQAIDPGFEPGRVLVAPLNINLLRYTRPQGAEFYRQLVERVEALPGVESASLARVVLLSGAARQSSVLVEGQGGPDRVDRSEGTGGGEEVAQQTTLANVVGLGYLQTMGIALLRGRDFGSQDREGAPGVVIINETFARRHFPGQDPLGRRISLNGPRGPWREIVGMTRDGKYRTLGEAPAPFVHLPLAQNHETGMTLHVRAAGDPAGLVAAVRGEIRGLERNLPATDIRPLTEQISRSLFPARMGAALLGVFGLIALLLATVGLYGVMSYAVARRTRELGVRMALGAQPGDVLRLVLREGMTLIAAGVGLGLAGALAVTRLLASFLYGVSTTDPATFAGLAALLAAVALLASLIPARRAARVDPMVALRQE